METIFLLGAGRSGTTLLYKLLCLHEQVGFISNYNVRFPAWVPAGYLGRLTSHSPILKLYGWFDGSGGAYFNNRPLLKKIIPSPREGEEIYKRCGIPPIPAEGERLGDDSSECLFESFQRLRAQQGARVLLTKRTANNRRIAQLRQVFPEAGFISLVRDGRAVASSLINVEWWRKDKHKVWWDGRTVNQMLADGEDELEIAARNWLHETEAIQAGLADVPDKYVHTLRYESLMQDPLAELERVFSFMGLAMNPRLAQTVASLGLELRPEKWLREWDPSTRARVERIQGDMLSRLGYEPTCA